jgi:hypothetical protein
MVIRHWVLIKKGAIVRDNILLPPPADASAEGLYRHLGCSYAKFFKMDKLCKRAWLGAEYLLGGSDEVYRDIDKNKIAILLTTTQGCMDVDKRYLEGIAMPSPALFVYTLPNIMLGEISIRRGFKGEQLCMVNEGPDAEELFFNVQDILNNKGMDACLCGWADANENDFDVCLFWITKDGDGIACSPAVMQELYRWQP